MGSIEQSDNNAVSAIVTVIDASGANDRTEALALEPILTALTAPSPAPVPPA